MFWFGIVLGEPFPNLSSSDANYRIRASVIGGIPAKDQDSQGPLLDMTDRPRKRLFDDVAEQGGVPLAMSKEWVTEDSLQLLADSFAFGLGRWNPNLEFGLIASRHRSNCDEDDSSMSA
jgi:hypothetical protein